MLENSREPSEVWNDWYPPLYVAAIILWRCARTTNGIPHGFPASVATRELWKVRRRSLWILQHQLYFLCQTIAILQLFSCYDDNKLETHRLSTSVSLFLTEPTPLPTSTLSAFWPIGKGGLPQRKTCCGFSHVYLAIVINQRAYQIADHRYAHTVGYEK
ncbi:hypothetical protein DFH27DRAFT_64238 [Peziza echinospora]|nr:hypothetical protein DFH27DRAFT_64238 [Peziza echinospora]